MKITNKEMAFARPVFEGTMAGREAAERAAIDPGRPTYVKGKSRVKDYMQPTRASVTASVQKHESGSSVEHNIDTEQIIARLWDLAGLSPEDTDGDLTCQIQALDSISKILGLVGPKAAKPPASQARPNIYRAAWMPKLDGSET